MSQVIDLVWGVILSVVLLELIVMAIVVIRTLRRTLK